MKIVFDAAHLGRARENCLGHITQAVRRHATHARRAVERQNIVVLELDNISAGRLGGNFALDLIVSGLAEVVIRGQIISEIDLPAVKGHDDMKTEARTEVLGAETVVLRVRKAQPHELFVAIKSGSQKARTARLGLQSVGGYFHPLDQFLVKSLFGHGPVHWYTPTNVTLWMGIALLCIVGLFVLGSRGRAVIPTRIQSIGELIYGFIYKMVEDVTGKDGVKYFPYIMTLFVFILFANYLALIPMSYSPTSMIAVTAVLGFGVFIAVTILGFVKNGASFLGLFWMSDAPAILRPIIAIIEVISYFVRPVSHSIRLAGNIMAGHAVLKVFAGFAALTLVSPIAIFGIVAIYGLEVLVAGIQAYVFTILTCVYLKDALHPHH